MGLKEDFMTRKKMQVCITGGTGFIGRSLVNKLINIGMSLRILTRNSKTSFSGNVDIILGDLTSPYCDLHKFLIGCDVLINCAGDYNNLANSRKIHIDGLKRLLEHLNKEFQDSGKRIHFVQLSSVGVYGTASNPSQPRVICERSELFPRDEYELSKAAADKIILEEFSLGYFSYTILRPSNVVGFNMPNSSFGSLINAIKTRKFFFIGSRLSIATYIHVEDVADALIKCALDKRGKNQIFNLSNDCKFSDIVSAVLLYNNLKCSLLCCPEKVVRALVLFFSQFIKLPLTKNRIDALVSKTTYSSRKIQEFLVFIPSVSIAEFAVEYSKTIDAEK
jgi:nucleoside-diphosphate-sugar epimerase